MQLKTLIFMVLLLSGLAFPVAIAACGNLAAATSYTLTNNIANHAGTCFTTLGAGVVFNGQGFEVDGIGSGSAFFDGNGNFIVQNVKIKDEAYAIYENGNTMSTSNISGTNISAAGYIFGGTPTSIYINNNSFASNATYGIYFIPAGAVTGVVIANSTFNASSYSIYLDNTQAKLFHLIVNSSIYQTTSGKQVDYWNVTASDYRGIFSPANQTTELNYTDIGNTSGIMVKTYNHDTLARINYANYSVTNATANMIYDRYWLMLDYRYGANTSVIVSENTNYYPSYLVGDAPFENGFGDQILLMPKTASNLATINFHIVSSSNTPISGATCGAFKVGTSAWMLLGAKKTDSTGVFGLIMQTTTQYKLICSASGYLTYTTYLTPVSSDYTITLSSTTYGLGFPTSIEGVRYSFNQSLGVAWNVTQTFNFTVFNTSANSSIDWFSMAVYNGTTLLYSSNDTTHPSGYSITYTFMAGNNSNISVVFGLKRQSRDGIVWNIRVPTYYGYTSSGGASLTDALSSLSSLGSLTIVFLTLIVGAIVGGYASQISAGAGVVAFMGILTMGFLISSTIMSGALLLMAFVVAGGYFILRGGG